VLDFPAAFIYDYSNTEGVIQNVYAGKEGADETIPHTKGLLLIASSRDFFSDSLGPCIRI
jgi:hypothetical protein